MALAQDKQSGSGAGSDSPDAPVGAGHRAQKSFLHSLIDPVELLAESLAAPRSAGDQPAKKVVIESVDDLFMGRELGRGIQGVVFLARHKSSGRRVAVKVSSAKTEHDRQELRGEIKVLSLLEHENVVRFYGALYKPSAPPKVFSICELMDSGCMLNAIHNTGPIPEPVLSQLAGDCLRGLVFLHHSSVLHRDMKTANILLCAKSQTAKLTDFGLSVCAEAASSFRGTIEYMAPEKLRGEPYTAKADVWSLGLCVIEAHQGAHPFPNRPEYWDFVAELSTDHLFESIHLECSDELRSFCEMCTKVDIEDRWHAGQLLNHPWIEKHASDKLALGDWFSKLMAKPSEPEVETQAGSAKPPTGA